MIIALRGKQGSGKSTAAAILQNQIELVRRPVQTINFADPIKAAVSSWFPFSQQILYGPSEERDKPLKWSERDAWQTYEAARASAPFRFERMQRALRREFRPDFLSKFWRWLDGQSTPAARAGEIVPRRVLQTFGTEFGRECLGESVWVDLALAAHRDFTAKRPNGITLIGDCRFDNEVITVAAQPGGYVVEIVSPPEPRASELHEAAVQATSAHASEQRGQAESDLVIVNDKSRGLTPLRNALALFLEGTIR